MIGKLVATALVLASCDYTFQLDRLPNNPTSDGGSDDDVLVPSTVVAQVWRGSRRQASLARALRNCETVAFDGLERVVGELCGRTKTLDICDAHVALVAMNRDLLYTADPSDLRRLLADCPGRAPRIVRC